MNMKYNSLYINLVQYWLRNLKNKKEFGDYCKRKIKIHISQNSDGNNIKTWNYIQEPKAAHASYFFFFFWKSFFSEINIGFLKVVSIWEIQFVPKKFARSCLNVRYQKQCLLIKY